MILFFDTETTGFFQDRLPIDDPDQPYIVQLAAQLCRDDGDPVAGFSFIVDPGIANGISIPARAAEVHGITDEIAVQFGVSAEFALKHFFGEDLDGAHDAMVDVTACRRVYLHLKTLEAVQ